MDLYSSGEDLVIKTRKPYTITKQRERWTEEEHNRFLEALKLYGRAWQRIEEHIGTKTAVQIRSHAQKFFTKLEKEAIVKGVPIGHALDIEIPPPRPKRKPSNPYPRKTSAGTLTSQVGVKDEKISTAISSSCQSEMTLEKEPEKPCDDGKLGCNSECPEKDNCSKAFTFLKTVPYATQSSAYMISSVSEVSRTFRQYVPLSNEASNPDETAVSQVTIEAKGSQTEQSYNKQPFQDNPPFKISNVVNSYLPQEKSVHTKSIDELKQPDTTNTSQTADVQASQNYPRHVPVHILDGSLGLNASNISTDLSFTDSMIHQMGGGVHSHQNLSAPSEHYNNASKSSTQQSFPSYHPVFTPVQNQDDYHSFVHMSTTFSSLIVSALSQNPASYAAASFAATMWPSLNMEAPGEPSIQSRPISTAPSMAAIAAATVAAATAWWAAHGLLPLCAPYHPAFTCSPSATPMESSQDRTTKSERRVNSTDPALGGQQLEPECSEALHEQNSVSKSPALSSSDSDATEGAKLNDGSKLNDGLAASETAKVEDKAELDNANKHMNKKPVDRSSCGSNTPSSSEVEGDALEKHAEGIEETEMKDNKVPEELDATHPVGDPFSRRCRGITNANDSWKEVSEGGRIAFQALFSRERLPQSFSPPHKGKKNCSKEEEMERNGKGLELDLNGKAWEGTCSQKQGEEENAPLMGENKEEGLHNIGLGQGKLKARRTGFKPYKRCSMEAKECRVSANGQDEEKCPKRIRLEGEAST